MILKESVTQECVPTKKRPSLIDIFFKILHTRSRKNQYDKLKHLDWLYYENDVDTMDAYLTLKNSGALN